MTVDPVDPEALAELAAENEAENEAEAAPLDEEAPEADAAEQHTELQQRTDNPPTGISEDAANEADAIEQARVITLDEDDYRG